MLFDLKPKEKLKDLFGRKEDYDELSRLIDSGSWVAVLGKRMTGKTSLIKTFANETKGTYINLLGVRGLEGLATRLLEQSREFLVKEVGVDFKFVQAKWSRVAQDALSMLRSKHVIVLDEIQDVASSPYLLKVLKASWDTYHELRIIFSGSYIGIMRSLLDPDEGSPLYGRSPAKMVLKPFSVKDSKAFLLAGFKEHPDVNVSEDQIEEAVEKLGGYAGWLTYYGNFRCIRRMSHERALSETKREGSKIISSELKNFLKNRRKDLYLRALRVCSHGARWTELKRELKINSKVLSFILDSLKSVDLVEEEEGYYWIDDPILKEAIKLLLVS